MPAEAFIQTQERTPAALFPQAARGTDCTYYPEALTAGKLDNAWPAETTLPATPRPPLTSSLDTPGALAVGETRFFRNMAPTHKSVALIA